MAVKYTKQYSNLSEMLYDYSKNTTFFDAATYEKALQEGTADEYASIMLDVENRTSTSFDKAKYDMLDQDTRYAYLMNEFYGDKNSEEYKKNAAYFNDVYVKAVNKEQYEALNPLQKTGKTIGGLFSNAWASTLGLAEGLIDAALYLGSGGGLIEGSRELISKDATGKIFDILNLDWKGYAELQKKLSLDYSGIDSDGVAKAINDIATGIIRMSPMIIGYALSPVTGGVGAVIGKTMYYGSMWGNLAEEAITVNPDISFGNLLGYTAGSVALEAGIESLSDKIGGSLFGGKGAGVSWWKQMGIDFLSEGAEEMVSELTGSLLYQWTVDPNAPVASIKDILYAGLIGGLTGSILSGGKVLTTSRFTVDSQGNLIQMKDARKAGLTIDKSKVLSKGKSYNAMAQMRALNENIDKSSVIKLQEKYSDLSLNDIKIQHAEEYQKAFDKDTKTNQTYIKTINELAAVLKTIGETNFTKAVDILNYSYEKAATLMDNFKNNVNAYSVEAKAAQLLFSKANPGMNIAISEDLTKLERRLRDWLKSELNIDTFFGTVGSENGVDPGQIVTTGNNIFIQKGIFDIMSMDQVMETVVKRKIVDNVMQDISKIRPRLYAEAMQIVNETDTTEYNNLTEEQKRTLTQMLLYDPITIGKTFQRNKNVFQRMFDTISKGITKNRETKKKNNATKLEFAALVKARNEYINQAAQEIGNFEDAETFKQKLHMSDDMFETMLKNKFLPSILNEYYVLAEIDNHQDAVNKNRLIKELLLNSVETDLTAPIDWTNISNESYFVTTFIDAVKKEYPDLEWEDAIWEYIYDNYNLVWSAPNNTVYSKIDMVEYLKGEVRSELNDAIVANSIEELTQYTNINQLFTRDFLRRFDKPNVTITWNRTSGVSTTARTVKTTKGLKIEVYAGQKLDSLQTALMHEVAHVIALQKGMPFGTSADTMAATLRQNVPESMVRGLAFKLLTEDTRDWSLDQIIDELAFQMYIMSKGEVYARGDAKAYAMFKDGFVVDDEKVMGIGKFEKILGLPFEFPLAKTTTVADFATTPKKKRLSTKENTGTRFYDFIQENNIDLTKDFDEDFVVALENELLVTEKDFLRKINSDSVGNNKATNIVIDYFFGEKNKHLRTIEDVEEAIDNLGAVYVYHMWRSQKDDNYSVKKSPTNEAIENFKKRKKVLTLTDKNGEEVVAATLIDRMDKRFKTARDNPKNSELKTYLLKMDYSQTGEQIAEIAKGVFGQFGINTQTLKTNNQQYEDEDGKTSQEIDNLADKEQQGLEQQAIEEIQGAPTIFNTNDPDELIDTLETLASDVENWDTLVETDKKETVDVTTEEFKSLSKKDVVDAIEQKKTLYIIKDDKTTAIDLNDGRQYSVRGDTLFVKTDSGVLTDVAEISALTDTPEKITKTENVPTGKKQKSPLGEFIRNKFNDTAIKQKLIKTFSEFIYDKIEEPFVNSELTDEQKASAEKSLAEKYSVEDVNKIKQLVADKDLSPKKRESRRKEILQEFEQKYGESIVEKIGTLIPDSKAGTDKKIVTQRKKLSKFENLTAEEQHLLNIDLKSLKFSEHLRLLERLQEANEKRNAKIAKKREVNAKKRKLNDMGELTPKQQELLDVDTTGFTEEQYDTISKELTIETAKASKTVKEVTKKATEAAKVKEEKAKETTTKKIEKVVRKTTEVPNKLKINENSEASEIVKQVAIETSDDLTFVDKIVALLTEKRQSEAKIPGEKLEHTYVRADTKVLNSSLFLALNADNLDSVRDKLRKMGTDESLAALNLVDIYVMENIHSERFAKKYDQLIKEQEQESYVAQRQGLRSALLRKTGDAKRLVKELKDAEIDTDTESESFAKLLQEYDKKLADKDAYIKELQEQLTTTENELREIAKSNEQDLEKQSELAEKLKTINDFITILKNGDNIEIADWLIEHADDLRGRAEIQSKVFEHILNNVVLAKHEGKEIGTFTYVGKDGQPIAFPEFKKRMNKFASIVSRIRYGAMLSSPITWVRNYMNNQLMYVLGKTTDWIERGINKLEFFQTGYADPRQFQLLAGKEDKLFTKYLKDNYYDFIFDWLGGSKNKMDVGAAGQQVFEARRKITQQTGTAIAKALSKIESIIYKNLETGKLGDRPILTKSVLSNLSNLITANKSKFIAELKQQYGNVERVKNNGNYSQAKKEIIIKALETQSTEAVFEAIALDQTRFDQILNTVSNRALEQFFKNDNRFSKMLRKLSDSSPTAKFLVGIINPFYKVGSNVLAMAYKYSPLNFINAVSKLNIAKQVTSEGYSGKVKGTEVAETARAFSQATVGTSLLIAGILAAAMGLIDIDDDDYMGPSLNIFGYRLGLANLAPALTTLSIGAAIVDSTKNDNNLINNVADVLYSNTLLGNVDNLFKYSSSTKFFENLSINYVTSYVPAVIKLVQRVTDPNTKDKSGNYLDKLLKNIGASVPGLSYVVPNKINPYTGEAQTRYGSDNFILNLIAAINPLDSSYSYLTKSDLQSEAERLDVKTSGVSGAYKINDKEYTLTAEEKTAAAKYRANYIQEQFDLISSGKQKVTVKMDDGSYETTYYNNLTDEQKANVLENLYSTASTNAKIMSWIGRGNVYRTGSKEEYDRLKKLFESQQIQYKKGYKKSKFVEV